MINKLILDEVTAPFAQHLANPITIDIPREVPYFTVTRRHRNKVKAAESLRNEHPRDQDALTIYINNYFRGVLDTDYLHAISRDLFYKQKINNIQEIDQTPFEKKNIFLEKEREFQSIKIELLPNGSCMKCSAKDRAVYYEILQREFCEDCGFSEYPDQISKFQLRQLIAKREAKGQKYEAKLNRYYDQTLREQKQQKQVVLNGKQQGL